MFLGVDLSETKPYRSTLEPKLSFRLRPLAGSAYGYAVDHAARIDGDGSRQFDVRALYAYLFRFGVQEIEGLDVQVKAGQSVPPLHVDMPIMGERYPFVTSYWFDRVPPDVVSEVAVKIREWNTLTDEEKKTSSSPAGGA